MVVYKSHKTNRLNQATVYKHCLGNFECPVQDCGFHLRPLVPKKHTKDEPARAPKNSKCLHHQEQLKHISCSATLKIITTLKSITFFHQGTHNHQRPHSARPDLESLKEFTKLVKTAPEIKPKGLQMGTASREPLANMHPSFGNLGRTAYLQSKIKKTFLATSCMGQIANFEKNVNVDIIVSSSLERHNAHISLQTSMLKQRLLERQSPLQTDSIEGFVVDQDNPNINLCITSGYDTINEPYHY